MSVGELWELHESVVAELSRKMAAERAMLENRLRQLGSAAGSQVLRRTNRPYPKILPKYRNPKNRRETWTGRGKQPRWLTAQLRKKAGRLSNPKVRPIAKPEPRKTSDLIRRCKKVAPSGITIETARQLRLALLAASFEIANFDADVGEKLKEFGYRHFFDGFFKPPPSNIFFIRLRLQGLRHVAHTNHFVFLQIAAPESPEAVGGFF